MAFYKDPDTIVDALKRALSPANGWPACRSPWLRVKSEWRTVGKYDTGYEAQVKHAKWRHCLTEETEWTPISNGYTNLWRLVDESGEVVKGVGS